MIILGNSIMTNFLRVFFLFSVIASFSCNSKRENNNLSDISSLATSDSLRNSMHFYYFADINSKTFGNWILADSISPSDNFSTFRLMDSLNAKAVESRMFYFSVFNKILEKADGALAEAVGLYALKYVENHTTEFLSFSKSISNEIFEKWARNVGVEIYLSSENPTEEAQYFIKRIERNCINCSLESKEKLETFKIIVNQAITENED